MTGALIGTQPPLIPRGEYQAVYLRHTFKYMFKGRPKLYLSFLVDGPRGRVQLVKYYNVTEFVKRDGEIKGFKCGWKSDIYRDAVRLFGSSIDPEKLTSDDILKAFEDKEFILYVSEVKSDSKGNSLHAATWYSRVDEIMRVA